MIVHKYVLFCVQAKDIDIHVYKDLQHWDDGDRI